MSRLNKLLTVFLSALVVFTAVALLGFDAVAANSPMEIEADTLYAMPGESIEVKVSVSNVAQNLGAISLKVAYDETALTLVEVDNGGALSNYAFTNASNLNSGAEFSWLDTSLQGIPENGMLMTLKFDVAENAMYGTYPINISHTENRFLDKVENVITDVAVTNGAVTVMSYKPGDATENGVSDIGDALRICRYISSGRTMEINEFAADPNGDGAIDIADALRLCRYVAGHNVELLPSPGGYDHETATYTDIVIANDNWGLNGTKAYSGRAMLYSKGTVNFDVEDDLVGQHVTVYYSKNNGYIYDMVATGNSNCGPVIITSTGSRYTIKVGDTMFVNNRHSSELEGSVKIVAAGVKNSPTNVPYTISQLYDLTTGKTTAYSVYGYDIDGDLRLDYTFVSETEYGEISEYNRTYKSFKVGRLTAAADDIDETVFVNGPIVNGTVVKVAKDYITGRITVTPAYAAYGSFTGIAGTKYTIGGTQYEIAKDAIDTEVLTEENLGKPLTVYTDGKYIIKAELFDAFEEVAPQLTNKLAMLVDGSVVESEKDTYDEWGNKTGTEPVYIYKIKVLLSSGATVILEYDKDTKTGIEVASLFNGVTLSADYVGKVFEYVIGTNGKVSLKTNLAKTHHVKYYIAVDNTADTLEAINAGAEVEFNKDTGIFKAIGGESLPMVANDSTLIFATYTNEHGEKEYKMVKVSDLPTNTTYTLIASSTDVIATAMILKVEYSFREAPDVTETPYIIATSGVELRYDTEAKKVFAYFDAVDLNNAGAAKEYKAADDITVSSGKIYELTVEDGVVKAAAEDTWTKKTVTAKNGDMFMIDGALTLAEDFAKNVKVIVKSGSTYTKGTIDSITVAKKTTEANMMVKVESGKIAYVIVTADGSKLGF